MPILSFSLFSVILTVSCRKLFKSVCHFGLVMSSIDGRLRELEKQGTVKDVSGRIKYSPVVYVVDVGERFLADERNRIAWDGAEYFDRLIEKLKKGTDVYKPSFHARPSYGKNGGSKGYFVRGGYG